MLVIDVRSVQFASRAFESLLTCTLCSLSESVYPAFACGTTFRETSHVSKRTEPESQNCLFPYSLGKEHVCARNHRTYSQCDGTPKGCTTGEVLLEFMPGFGWT